jgi:GTP-binding protein
MKILAAEFIESTTEPHRFAGARLPEVAIAGRSNVGKSSLINALFHRKALAKVSRTPGKTRTVNFFRVATSDPLIGAFYLVDLPGYGYAEVAKTIRASWRPMIERYLEGRPALKGVLLLVDARQATEQDAMMAAWLEHRGRPAVVIATKLDKLARGERGKKLHAIRQCLALPEPTPLIPYSSVTGEGERAIWQALRDLLAE